MTKINLKKSDLGKDYIINLKKINFLRAAEFTGDDMMLTESFLK